MAVEWTKVGTDVVVGGLGGSVSKLAEDWDADRAAKKGAALGMFEQFGTYVDYGVPLLGLLGAFAGFLKGDWETRVLTMGGTLAGRRVTGQIKKATAPAGWVKAGGGDARAAAAAAARRAAEISRALAAGQPPGGPGTRAWVPQAVRA